MISSGGVAGLEMSMVPKPESRAMGVKVSLPCAAAGMAHPKATTINIQNRLLTLICLLLVLALGSGIDLLMRSTLWRQAAGPKTGPLTTLDAGTRQAGAFKIRAHMPSKHAGLIPHRRVLLVLIKS